MLPMDDFMEDIITLLFCDGWLKLQDLEGAEIGLGVDFIWFVLCSALVCCCSYMNLA